MEKTLEKLRLIAENPGYYKGLTPEEQAELFLYFLQPKPKLFKKPKVIQGIDGATPVADKDYISKETALAFLADIAKQLEAKNTQLEKAIQDKLATLKPGKDGSDAVITDDLIATVAQMAASLVKLPDFETIITQSPEAIRDALELLQDDERLDVSAIKGLSEKLDRQPQQGYGGGVSRGMVQQMIDESAGTAASTFETVSKNLDATDATLNYTGDNLTSIVYGSGVTKTFNYTGDNLTSVVLSGTTPSGIDLTKTLSYTGTNLTGVAYS